MAARTRSSRRGGFGVSVAGDTSLGGSNDFGAGMIVSSFRPSQIRSLNNEDEKTSLKPPSDFQNLAKFGANLIKNLLELSVRWLHTEVKLVKLQGRSATAAFWPSGLSLQEPAGRFHGAACKSSLTETTSAWAMPTVLPARAVYRASVAFPELLCIKFEFCRPGRRPHHDSQPLGTFELREVAIEST